MTQERNMWIERNMKGQFRDIVLLMCTYIQVTYSRPIQIDSFYQFWKTVDKQSIPQTQALQKLSSLTIESFCETDEILDSIPSKQSCDEYIQTLSSKLSCPVTAVTSDRHIKNPNKFMKALIKNTIVNLNDYNRLVQLLADEYSKSTENCQDKICRQLNSLSSNLNSLIKSITFKIKQYFHINILKKQSEKSFSLKDRSQVEKVATLYCLFTQLKEAESALEFTVKSTWDVQIRKMANFQNKKKRPKLVKRRLNLGL
ncbi:hypothetical protein LOTGIDRAFT_239242 [Lottia gigantea]|uniref:Uncharacterized protein n=1 Tax=Lottia gigantea TaxID=225164 RepID=V4C568_LOTGI|nr:hypothetical protein LOTGIDRAFT_239242 [Lottia gigantea]ESO96734.1 hypothetical protein LOTGIDRAFT_239242 [Lottia gigantea]